ncbi:MAG: redox-sensing transcriptional repressor Rex [Clostridia bacterium]|nr:redox-sensing transcriptional repressor Rex [Clostridia bacterium]
MRKTVSRATLGRVPIYLKYLKTLSADEKYISATKIASNLKLGDVLVRKDLQMISGDGKPKVGYEKNELMLKLGEYLENVDKKNHAVIVGAGKLGCALLSYNGFGDFGVDIVAAFDTDEGKIGTHAGGKPIYSANDFKKFCLENDVNIGIITVPALAAQRVCDEMIECGIKAIWNFGPASLNVPENIIVQQENLALSLAYLNVLVKG